MTDSPPPVVDGLIADHSRLLYYVGADGRAHPVTNRAEWDRRKRQILEGLQRVIGELPDPRPRPPLKLRVTAEIQGDGFRRRTIRFTDELGKDLVADLYLPDPAEKNARLPAMLALHPTGAQGKRIVAGEGPRPNRQYAKELAQRGYVVIAPDYPSFGDLSGYDFAADPYPSGTLKGILNHMRCVDVLQSLEIVDPQRIGVIGHSLGGHNAIFVAVFDPRIKVIVTSCGWTPFHDYYGGNLKGWTSDRYMPRIRDVYGLDPDRVPFDFYELIAALAPRPFFSNSPLHDSNFDVRGVKKAIPRIREVYALFSAADRVQVVYPPCGHDFPTEIRIAAYRFIDRALKHKPRREIDFSGELPRFPALSPQRALGSFRLVEGFEIQLAASEPLVTDPVAMSFDADGRLYVVEMRDYSEQEHERLGRIRLLEDTNGDGRFDKATVFAQRLSWPTAIICYDGGVFVGAPPDIHYMKDTDGDGRADVDTVVWTGFGRSNVQGLMNSFRWGLDNRIYGATSSSGAQVRRVAESLLPVAADSASPSRAKPAATGSPTTPIVLRGRDFSFDPRTLDFRPESGGGQHGMSFDDWGRRYVCSNSDHAQFIVYDDRYIARNPYLAAPSPRVRIAVDGGQAPVFRISPVEPWRVVRTRLRVAGIVRGPVEGGGRAAGYFTGSTGIQIYRGDAFPADCRGQLFVADVGSNIVHRKRVEFVDVVPRAVRIDRNREFLASTDTWFRPVQLENGPDGGLYVLDMYREVIEHPKSLPPQIKRHLDLTSGRDRGRIYRIVPSGFRPARTPQLTALSSEELVGLLSHRNAWHRETAARLLYERQDRSIVPLLEKTAVAGVASAPSLKGAAERRDDCRALGRLHALYVLAGLDALRLPIVTRALNDPHPRVREHAVRLAERFAGRVSEEDGPTVEAFRKALIDRAADPDPRVRMQFGFSIGAFPVAWRIEPLAALLERDAGSVWIRTAALSSLSGGADQVARRLAGRPAFVRSSGGRAALLQLVRQLARRGRPQDIEALQDVWKRIADQDALFAAQVASEAAGRRPQVLESLRRGELAGVFDRVVRAVLRGAESSDAGEAAAAIELLRLVGEREALPRILAALAPTRPPQVQRAAWKALSAFRSPEVATALIERWSELTPSARGQVERLMQSRPAWAIAFLDAVLAGRIRTAEINVRDWRALERSSNAAVAERVRKLLETQQTSPRAEVVRRYRAALTVDGDPIRGRAVFRRVCAACHRFFGEGTPIGPDLQTLQNRGPETILVNVFDPNREVNPQYQNYLAITADGRTISGVITEETATGITLTRAGGETHRVLRAELESLTATGQSLMPEGLEKQLTVRDFADLLAYLALAN
ncbi:MAG: alpha/beta fold hydrolase [Planctomycetota bacterium]|nr:MAG: alpha/beta fold hydrolase [Planctomycetota bacterium]